jgi:predicted kinase
MKIKQPNMIILCGLPGAGKSTWIKTHNKGFTVVKLDWIRQEIYGHQFHTNAEFFIIGMARSMVRLLLSQGKNVIIDGTGLTRGIRNDWIEIGNDYNANIKIVWIKTSIETCLKRNSKRKNKVPEDVIQRMNSMFCPPIPLDFYNQNSKVKVIVIKE